MKNTHTHKGHCQACGRLQAVDNGSKMVAKHGYKVAGFGFFMGTCQGSDKQALELDKSFSERMLTMLREYISEQGERMLGLRTGKVLPETVVTSKYIRTEYIGRRVKPGTGCYERVPFAQGDDYQKARAVESDISACQHQIRQAQDHIEFLTKLVNEIHGKDLRPNKELGRTGVQVGSKVMVYGTERVVTAIAYKTAHGIGPAVNGRCIEHVGFEVDGVTRWYPKRYAREVR